MNSHGLASSGPRSLPDSWQDTANSIYQRRSSEHFCLRRGDDANFGMAKDHRRDGARAHEFAGIRALFFCQDEQTAGAVDDHPAGTLHSPPARLLGAWAGELSVCADKASDLAT